MPTEIEAKFLDINVVDLRQKLTAAGATLVQPERLMRRKNFDYPDRRLEKSVAGWIRVRDEGDKITLAYKQFNDRGLLGTHETSVMVDSFDQCCAFLEVIGLKQTSFQETKRESWRLGEADIEIDTWPWLPPFLEIEAATEQAVRAAATKLGFAWSKALHGSVEIVYQKYFNVTEQEVDSWPFITFTPTPDSSYDSGYSTRFHPAPDVLLFYLVNRALHIERFLGLGVVLALDNFLETLDRVFEPYIGAGPAGEHFGHAERLGQEPLQAPGALDRELILFG